MTAILLMAWAACMFVILAVFSWRNLISRRDVWRVIVVWCLTGTTIAASLAAAFAWVAMYVDATYSAMRDGGDDITSAYPWLYYVAVLAVSALLTGITSFFVFTRTLCAISALQVLGWIYLASMLQHFGFPFSVPTIFMLIVFVVSLLAIFKFDKSEQISPANRRPFGTSGMAPADPASRAGAMPEAGGDS